VTDITDGHRGSIHVLWAWLAVFVGANLASTFVVVATGHATTPSSQMPTWVLALGALGMWTVSLFVVGRYEVHTNVAPMLVRRSLCLTFSPRDLWGIPVGVLSQFVLVPAVNWPLQRIFPDTFSFDQVSRRAKDLVLGAHGVSMILLILVVVVGAPLVEEIIYRGMVHRDVVKAWGPTIGTIFTAALFAAIHLTPVEFPGLFAFALVLGVTRERTGTLGLPIVSHLAFNAAGLFLVALS